MESHQIKISIKIEPKPGGGFIATSDHHPDIEGATREEVEQKVREALLQAFGPQLAAMIPFLHVGVAQAPQGGAPHFSISVKKTTTTNALPGSNSGALPASNTNWQTSVSNSSGPIDTSPERIGAYKFLAFALLLLIGVIIAYALSHR